MEYQLIESSLNYCTPLEQILTNRGIEFNEIEHYLNTTDDDILDPNLIDNLYNGSKMLCKHMANNDKTMLIVDCDADGYTSSAFLLNYLNRLFPSYAQNNIDYKIHSGKQHGLENEFVYEAINNQYKLIICPDSASNDYAAHKILSEHGIDVLVIDHHKADYVSPDACVINNQLCSYPNKTLSGVGMVYKFCCYLDNILKTEEANDFLDLVSVGMIADMMDLRNFETKHLVNKGLKQIQNPFVLNMVKAQHYSIDRAGGLCPFSVSFYIAPQINATIRMGDLKEKTLLFESMLEFKAYDLIPSTKRGCRGQQETVVEQVCRNCNNIKNRQTKARDASLEIIEKIIEKKNLTENKIIAIKVDHSYNIDKNLTGLMANQLMAKYQHPVLLLTETSNNGELAWAGSGRGFETLGFDNLQKFLKESGYVYLAEGHENALGVGIQDNEFNSFIEYSNDALEECNFTPSYKVDFIWRGNQCNPQDIIKIAELNSIWGEGIKQPKIAIENIKITPDNITLMSPDKSPTLKIQLQNGISLIKFKSSKEEYESLVAPSSGYVEISIVGTCNINEWNGRVLPQIQIEDYEITKIQQYYF